ncbi:MAG: hypothetical protein OMM_10635, partial [Candidatus Magnetoglobus multicellularis str. Araruama]
MAYEEFTDRVELLRELETWIKNIRHKRSGSTSIISPRRLGKTVLLERLVNTVFLKPQYQVAPIYFSKYNVLKGRFLENVVQVTMMKFNNDEIQGEWLGKKARLYC